GLELAGLQARARIVLEVGEVEFGPLEEAGIGQIRRLRARSLDEEQPSQRQRSAAAVVVAEDDPAPRGARAQVLADDPVLFGVGRPRPRSSDIADEAALVETGTRRLRGDIEAQPF